jgi:hypothetical protein
MSSALRNCALRRHRPSHHRAWPLTRNVVPCKDVRCDAAKRRFEPPMPGGKQMLDEKDLMLALKRHCDYSGMDEDVSHEIYHDDAVLEFPQSGERFEGVENFREWRRQYAARIAFHTRRITHRDDLVVVENLISYDAHHGCIPSTCLSSKATKWRMSAFTSWTGGKRRSGAHLGGPTRPRIHHHHLRRRTAESDGDPLARVAACVRGSARRDGAGGSVLACHGTKPSVTLADLCCLDQFRRARR